MNNCDYILTSSVAINSFKSVQCFVLEIVSVSISIAFGLPLRIYVANRRRFYQF
jgi:hypothetical protein